MNNGISNFRELLLNGDFFLIFLLILAIVIVATIVYLIKLQKEERLYYEDDDEEEEDTLEVTNPNKEERIIKQEKFDFEKKDDISSYETEQEEMAVTSISELEDRINEMKMNNTYNTHEKAIEEYEAEQENKAIISYEELLKRASASTISYESEEDIDGIRIGKVDTNKIETYSETNDKPYYKEETFLQSMKEFRRAL